MRKRYTRRQAAAALLAAAPALAGAPPPQAAKSEPDPLDRARKNVREAAAKLGEFPLEMSAEPAFIFRP